MKTNVIRIVFAILFFTACTWHAEEFSVDPVITDPAEVNMKITPSSPTVLDDIRLVIYDDCNYNTLVGVTRSGKTINIAKQFNSMMKWPCIMKNDTIEIGKLPTGTYILNYKLVDIAQSTPKIDRSYYFNLIVTQ